MVDGVEMVFSKEKMIERLKKEGRADGLPCGTSPQTFPEMPLWTKVGQGCGETGRGAGMPRQGNHR